VSEELLDEDGVGRAGEGNAGKVRLIKTEKDYEFEQGNRE
jgi:hypothetical protein